MADCTIHKMNEQITMKVGGLGFQKLTSLKVDKTSNQIDSSDSDNTLCLVKSYL